MTRRKKLIILSFTMAALSIFVLWLISDGNLISNKNKILSRHIFPFLSGVIGALILPPLIEHFFYKKRNDEAENNNK